MPLLRKQPFKKLKPPAGLLPDEEVFYCKTTNEIFRDYESFFDRTILCNSLVWSCSYTGRSGLTFQEALESEKRAERQLGTFPVSLQRPLLFLARLTHRSRLMDLNDDIFLFAKDRYFIGEVLDVVIGGKRVSSKILKVVAPASTYSSKDNSGVIVIDEDSDSAEEEEREPPAPEDMMYIVHPSSGANNRVMVKASQVSRKKGLFTREKSKLFLKHKCHSVGGIWSIKDAVLQGMQLRNAKFEDFFTGPRPKFTVSESKKKSVEKPESMPVDLSAATPSRAPKAINKAPSIPPTNCQARSPSEPVASSQPVMSPAERMAQREQERLAKLAKIMEERKKFEEEKQRRKEEREKEREKKREEKRIEMERLKEWSRPRDDMECDDLKPLPEFKEMKTQVPTYLFGDAMMILEFVNSFKTVFDFKQFFPKGFTWSDIEEALTKADPQGPLCDLLQMLLCALFSLQEEEAEEYQAQGVEGAPDEPEKKPSSSQTGEEEEADEDDQVSNNELMRSAAVNAQFSQLTFGMPLKDTLLDQFTLTEILRLHLMSSGAHCNQKNARYRYQQRGGYSTFDDPGFELRKQESGLLKKMQAGNIFDFSPAEKLRVLSTLMQQVLTYATVRDIVEDTYDKLRLKKYDLKILQWAEVRRVREEQAASYKRQMEAKVREQEYRLNEIARAEAIRKAVEQGLDPPVFPPLKNPIESHEKRKQREESESQEEEKRRAEFARKELEAMQQIGELQQTNALYPLGRDRWYRRYWLFQSLPAVLVEDYELLVPCADTQLIPSHSEEKCCDGETKPLGDLNTSSDKENEVKGCASQEMSNISDVKREGSGVNASDSADKRNVDDEASMEVEQTSDDVSARVEKKDSASPAVVDSSHSDGKSASTGSQMDVDSVQTLPESVSSKSQLSGSSNSVDQQPQGTESGSSTDQQEEQEPQPKWYIVDSKEHLQQLMAALNPRGFRESALQTALQDFKRLLDVTIDSCPLEMLCLPSSSEEKDQASRTLALSGKVQGTTQSNSASEQMELTLRDGLLDLEERIYVGSLGAMKVKDRLAWRAAVENGGYSPLTDKAPFVQLNAPKKNRQQEGSMQHIPEEVVARDLSHAVVQVARGVELRFMKPPLGEGTDKKKNSKEDKHDLPHKETQRPRIYERWEESALGATSLSHVFLHLSVLDKSIKWDRSAMRARCRLCRRRGNADKMLLCDKCDRGHHMFCLKPPMTKVPSGDWFCPSCRPKTPAPKPRKNRPPALSEMNEEEEEEKELPELENFSEEASEEEKQDSEEEAAEEDNEEASEVEEENEDVCTACREDGVLILCDVCPRSYHLHCAQPPLKKVPKGKWMCQVCVGGGRAGKIQLTKPKLKQESSKKGTPNNSSSSNSGKSGSRTGSRQGTPQNSLTPPSGRSSRKYDMSSREATPNGQEQSSKVTPKTHGQRSREVTPKSQGQKSKVTPRQQGQDDQEVTPKSWSNGRASLKRNASSVTLDGGGSEGYTQQSTSSKRNNSQTHLLKAAEDLLQELMNHEDAWPFLKPVDRKAVPDYYDVVKTPMDFSTIRNKMHQYCYTTPSQILDDVRLIFSNCIEYNTRTTAEYRAGQTLSKFFQTLVRRLGLDDRSGSTPPAAKKERK